MVRSASCCCMSWYASFSGRKALLLKLQGGQRCSIPLLKGCPHPDLQDVELCPYFGENLHRSLMPSMAPSSSHHVGVPSCHAWNSNHVSMSPTEGSVKQPASSPVGPFPSLGSLKVTLLWGRGLSGDQGCMPHRSPWE